MLQLKTLLLRRYKSLLVALLVGQAVFACLMLGLPDLLVLRLDFHADHVAEIQRKIGVAVLLLSVFTYIILKIEAEWHRSWAHLALGLIWFAFILISVIEVGFGYLELSGLFWGLCGVFGLSHLLLAGTVNNTNGNHPPRGPSKSELSQ